MLTIIFYYFGVPIEAFARGSVFAGGAFTVQLVTNVLCWVVALLTAVSGFQYIWANRSFIDTAK